MSNELVMAVQEPFQGAYELLEKYIDTCPEEIWVEVNGGWPVWQQIYHALATLDFMLGPDGAPAHPFDDPEARRLHKISEEYISKDQMRELARAYKAKVDSCIAKLSDEDLSKQNTEIPEFMGKISHAATLGMLASHTLYHVGSCDAALRDHGLSGVF